MSDQTSSEIARFHATAKGRVQGVGFRAFVDQAASSLGLTGWVRNRWDGTVEVLAEGDKRQLEQLLAALRRGPHSGYVDDVAYSWEAATGEFKRFTVRQTE